MTKISRRTFVKRSGAATLGGALGLGILPSLTRRLHASDTSTQAGSGVEILYSSVTDLASYKVNGGNLTISQVLASTAVPGSCVPSLKATRSYVFDYTKVVNGLTYNAHVTLEVHRYYSCVNGAPTVTYAYGNNIGLTGIYAGKHAIGTMEPGVTNADGGQSSSGKARLIFADGEWTDWYDGANLPYQVLCCALPV